MRRCDDPAESDHRGVGLLYPDMADLHGSDHLRASIEETGAVLMGRTTFEMGDPDASVGEYEFQVPIFVLTTHPPARPPKQDERLTFIFVSGDIATAVAKAKVAARN